MKCTDVKEQMDVESLACVNPYPEDVLILDTYNPVFRINSFSTYDNLEINCKVLERSGFGFYIYSKRFYIVKEDKVIFINRDGCGINRDDFIKLLYKYDKTLLMVFLYSLFYEMKRSVRAALDARYIADDATYTAHTARDTALAVYDATYTARDTALAADAALDAAHTADDALAAARAAACDAALAADAADAATYTAYTARDTTYTALAAVYGTAKKALRKLFKLRKIILEEI